MSDYRMRLFGGLDVSLAKTATCVVSEHGQLQGYRIWIFCPPNENM
jgi:hypothetical protein